MPSLLFVAAHPDDDTLGVARTIALHVQNPDLRFSLIHVTDGEEGEIAPDSGVRREDLGRARRQEAVDSWTEVGRLPDRHDWFGLPDGGLADHPFGDLVDRIAAVMAEERPDSSRHSDRMESAVSRTTRRSARLRLRRFTPFASTAVRDCVGSCMGACPSPGSTAGTRNDGSWGCGSGTPPNRSIFVAYLTRPSAWMSIPGRWWQGWWPPPGSQDPVVVPDDG